MMSDCEEIETDLIFLGLLSLLELLDTLSLNAESLSGLSVLFVRISP